MLAVLEILVIIVVVAVRVVVPMLLWAKLVHLLRARSKLVWTTIASHRHCRQLA